MAQLKDLLVAGPSRFIGDMFGNNLQINKIDAHTAAGGTTYGIGSAGQALCSDGTSVYWGYPTSSAHANLVTATNSVAYFTNTTGSFGSKPSANGALYATSANGALQWGTLPVGQGGTGKTSWTQWGVVYASAASTLANTAAGAANTALMGKGSAAPAFVSVSTTLATSTAATSSASQKIKVTVLGVASSELELTKATTGLYGTTKLTNSYSSTDESMATTGKALLAALQTLDVSAVGVVAATGNRYISQISETDGKISATLATATIGSGTHPIWIDGGTIKQTDHTLQADVPSNAVFTDTKYSAGTGISLSGTTFSNSGVRAVTINGNYLRVNTNGTNADLTIAHATNAANTQSGYGAKSFVIDGDADTYYPTLITNHTSHYAQTILNISRGYSEQAPDTWNTSSHRGGLTLTVLSNGDSAWGGTHGIGVQKSNAILDLSQSYCTIVADFFCSNSGLVVWLRGGGAKYWITSNNGQDVSATTWYEEHTQSSQTFNPTTTINTTRIDSYRWNNLWTINTATELSSSAGSTTQPIYFSNGKPTVTSYALKATVNNGTQWGVSYYSTTTNITSTAAGTTSQFLGGNGSAAPAWRDASYIINTLTTGSSDPVDADYYVAQYAGGGTSTTSYHRRPHSALWNYINGKITANRIASSTTYGVAYFTSATKIGSTAAGTAGYPLIGAGSAAPAWYGGQVNTGTAAASWKTDFNGTTDSTSATTGAITIDGGIGVAKNIWSNGFIKSGGFTSDTTITSNVFKPAITIYPSNSNEINFGGYYTDNRNIYFGYRKINDREIPQNYYFGPYGQASITIGEIAAGSTKDIYMILGNSKPTSEANNGRGVLRLYGTTANYNNLLTQNTDTSRNVWLPNSNKDADPILLASYDQSGAQNLNDKVNAGIYCIEGGSVTNYPSGGSAYANLLVIPYRKPYGNTTPDYAFQIYSHSNYNRLWFRGSNASTWSAWQEVAHIAANTAVGNSTTPVYVAANGTVTECSAYAGGTAVTLNNASKAASTASFYAPTAGGADNTQALVGAGTTTAPKWVNISPSCAWTAGTTAGPSLKVTVLGQTQGTGAAIPAASATASGVVLATTGTTEQWFKGWKGIYNEYALNQGTTAINANACARFMLRCKNTTTGHIGGTGVIRLFNNNQADDNNATMTIDCAGDLYIGGGEAPYNVLVAKGITNGENMYIVTDENTFIESNAGTAANRIGIVINTSGHLYPQKAEKNNSGQQDLGTTNSRWRALYVNTIDISQFHAGRYAANTAQSIEGQCGVRGGSGTLYLYSQTAVNSHRGLYGCNSAGTNAGYLTINKDNRINCLAPLELTSSSWWNQRTNARIRCDMSTGNNVLYPLWSMLTVNGNWALSTYSVTSDPDRLLFTYITNAQFNAGTNPSSFPSITFYPDGTILNSGYYRTTKYGTSAPTATAPNGSLYFVYKA